MHTIAVAGHICVDLWPRVDARTLLAPGRIIEVGPLAMTLGGPVGNTGRALMALGVDARAVTCVGDDGLGEFVRATLAAEGRSTAGLRTIPGASTSYSLILESPGLDRTIWHNVGANAEFDGAGIDLDGVDLLHVGYPPLLPALLGDNGKPLADMLAGARAAGITTSVDLAVVDPQSPVARLDWERILAAMAAQADVLTPSLDDLTSALRIEQPYSADLAEHLAGRLIEWGSAVVALSAGEHGLFVRTASAGRLSDAGRAFTGRSSAWADRRMYLPPLWTAEPVTTLGAGDACSAGLLYGLAVGADVEDAVRLAAACAAAAVSGRHTTPGAICDLRPDLAPLFDPPLNDATRP